MSRWVKGNYVASRWARSRTLVVLVSLTILMGHGLAARASQDAAAPAVRLPGHVLPVLSKSTAVARTQATGEQPIDLTIVLRRDHQAAFDRFLHELYDPHSARYRHFLTQSQLADRFGPSRQDYALVRQYLVARGFTIVAESQNRLTLTVRGRRAKVERAFDVTIRDYTLGKRAFFANDRDPALPREIASSVLAIQGLSNLATPEPGNFPIIAPPKTPPVFPAPPNTPPPPPGPPCDISVASACATAAGGSACYASKAAQQCYQQCLSAGGSPGNYGGQGLGGLLQQFVDEDCGSAPITPQTLNAKPSRLNFDGTGQTIGLVEFDSFVQSDVTNYLALLGLPSTLINNLSKVDVDGGVSPGPNQAEVLVDINAVLTTAPGVKIVVYDAPFTGAGSFQAVLNEMINNKVTIISNSWAYCEDQTTSADVTSIDSVLQNAAGAGISVFSGAGDSGSTCLDGSPNTISVPADSPNLTAVGGTSLTPGPGNTYGSETWWNGTSATPPTGQGGFGMSKFFPVPSYQAGLGLTGRSIPDLSLNADPSAAGVIICEAANGGCPNGFLYGGTSNATPTWAAFAALLNQALGANLGQINLQFYPLMGTSAFNAGASMSPASDFEHVGVGSPNLDLLELMLSGASPGSVSATTSAVYLGPIGPNVQGLQPADGATAAVIVVILRDANNHPVSGQTVSLVGSDGSSAKITPINGSTSNANGIVTFSITDLATENVTFTATGGGTTLTPAITPTINFVAPPAASAGIGANPTTVTADGVSNSTITITLEDALSRPSQGKLIQINQTGGTSTITCPNPPTTNSSGQVQCVAVDTNNETITYSATDVSDGNIPFPGTAQVTYGSATASGCGNATPTAAPGFVITPYVTGLLAKNFSYADGDINFGGCPGAFGIAFDGSNNIYVSDAPTGIVYKLPAGGGVASSTNELNNTLGPGVGSLVFENGNLYVVQSATTGGATTGAVMQLNPLSGAVVAIIASNLTCPLDMGADPLTGDLFVDNACIGGGFAGDQLTRIANPTSPTPTVSTYANLPNDGNYQISFAPDGTIYVFTGLNTSNYSGTAVEVGGTNTTQPASVNVVSNITPADEIVLAGGTASGGGAQYLISGNIAYATNLLNSALGLFDLTSNPPSASTLLANSNLGQQASTAVFGPDGCVYVSAGNAVFRVTDTNGDCSYTSNFTNPSLALTPPFVSPNPVQGTPQAFTATFHNAGTTTGIPVVFTVTGANPQHGQAITGSNGQATFSYNAIFPGIDTVVASASVSSSSPPVQSNTVNVTWTSGTDTTYLTVNQSPQGGTVGTPITLSASLIDLSQRPPVAVSGQTIDFSVGGQGCNAPTNSSGIATCPVTPSAAGVQTLTASFAGGGQFLAANASQGINVLTPASPTPTQTPTPTATPTPGTTAFDATFERLSGGPGAQVSTTFTATNNTGTSETISSVTIGLSSPSLFSALGVSANEESGEAAGPISSSNEFTFSPALTVGSGQSITFTIAATIASGATSMTAPMHIAYASVIATRAGAHDGLLPLFASLTLMGLGLLAWRGDSRKRSIITALALVVVLAASLAGCSGSSSGAPPLPSSTISVTSATTSGGGGATSGLPLDVARVTRN
ncbi:MAG TPA: protease pro-enzyme activation domain-containing protein [Candidatus Binataceae bacterium]|nr:protease pro-enzyme activation domain-containing protein [Candidatus Binataceae bacterium]